MAFAPPFQRPFSSPFDRRAAVAAAPWWLAGGVAAANAIAVYQPKGAASLAASYVNLANPGTYDFAPGATPPTLDASGWVWSSTSTGISDVRVTNTWTFLVRFSDFSTGVYGRNTWLEYCLLQPGVRRYLHREDSLTPGAAITSGVMGLAGNTAYLNGSSEGTLRTGSFTATGGQSFGLGNNKVQAVAIYNVTLTSTQVIAITNAMNLL